ncbi:MAG: ATP-binding cassette domain-containing protein [Firmicutes bacterium]|nr:ATP-binding cassette domain-containing protein [Bacillota bacterium]
MSHIIEVKNLVKNYKDHKAVKNVSFNVNKGEVFGFLGPNGAGKSTTINILCTIISLSKGEVYLDGKDVLTEQDEVRKKIGIIFQERTLDERLTARENLLIHARLYDVKENEIESRIDEVLEIVELSDRKNDFVSSYSGGMKRRLEIARGLMHYPKVLFLDEPTTGLDPQTRSHIWKYLLRLKKEHDMTIFLTTHYMDEAEICDNIAIIDEGEIVAKGTPIELKEKLAYNVVKFKSDNSEETIKYIRDNYPYEVFNKNDEISVKVTDLPTDFVTSFIRRYKDNIYHLEINRPTLDDVFMNITGHNIRD